MPLTFLSPIHKATRQISLYLQGAGPDTGASTADGHLLTYLHAYAPCPISELHRVLGHKRSTLTSMLDRLEGRGWLRRRLSPADRRSFLVELSRDGRRQAARIEQHLVDLERQIATRTTPRDIAGFQAVMAAIADVTRVQVRPRRDHDR